MVSMMVNREAWQFDTVDTFFFFFGVVCARSFVRDVVALYDTWGKCTYALVLVTCVGLAPGAGWIGLPVPAGLSGSYPLQLQGRPTCPRSRGMLSHTTIACTYNTSLSPYSIRSQWPHHVHCEKKLSENRSTIRTYPDHPHITISRQ